MAGNNVTIKITSFCWAGPRKPKHNVDAAVEITTVTIKLRALASEKHQIITLQLLKRILIQFYFRNTQCYDLGFCCGQATKINHNTGFRVGGVRVTISFRWQGHGKNMLTRISCGKNQSYEFVLLAGPRKKHGNHALRMEKPEL